MLTVLCSGLKGMGNGKGIGCYWNYRKKDTFYFHDSRLWVAMQVRVHHNETLFCERYLGKKVGWKDRRIMKKHMNSRSTFMVMLALMLKSRTVIRCVLFSCRSCITWLHWRLCRKYCGIWVLLFFSVFTFLLNFWHWRGHVCHVTFRISKYIFNLSYNWILSKKFLWFDFGLHGASYCSFS